MSGCGVRRWRRGVIAGLAGVLAVTGAAQGIRAQGADFVAPAVVAQQLVELPDGPVSFAIEQHSVDRERITMVGAGPGFLIGASGAALIEGAPDAGSVLLGTGEAAAVRADTAYDIEGLGFASLWQVGLRADAPQDAVFVGQPLSDLGGYRDLELLRSELGRDEQTSIASEAGIGLLFVLDGAVQVTEADGSMHAVRTGDALELDALTEISGADASSVIMAITLSEELDLGSASSDDANATPETTPAPTQAATSTPVDTTDTDGDGLTDAEEAHYGSDPQVADTDEDGLSDGDEVHIHGTDPTSMDTDGDGLPDYNEIMQHGTDPTKADTDGDGVSDHDELLYADMNPLEYDSDSDSVSDGEELAAGSSSASPDSDGDGLTDYQEIKLYGSSPTNADTDGDGVGDADEVLVYGTDPANGDSDGDGFSDKMEIDEGFDPLDASSQPPV